MELPYFKAIHVIFIVSWFAGLFYIVRLFVYNSESLVEEEPKRTILSDQYKIMQKRLWYVIAWPSLVIVYITGFWQLYRFDYWTQPWMIAKLILVCILTVYHLWCDKQVSDFQKNISNYTSLQYRYWNELATLLLFGIVFLVILKNSFNAVMAAIISIGLSVVLMIGIQWYKQVRRKNEK